MSATRTLMLALIVSIAAFAGCQDQQPVAPSDGLNPEPASLSKGAVLQSASGSGHFTTLGELRTFSFTVRKYADGSVSGMAEVHARGQNIRTHIAIDCLDISGNIARMSGWVVNATPPSLIGLACVFRVLDDGEGGNSQDRISLIASGGYDPIDCTQTPGPALHNVERGNIQVRP